MEIILNREQISENAKTLIGYLSDKNNIEEYNFAVSLIKRGTNFIVFSENNKYYFFPSRFMGYVNNSKSKHQNSDEIDGRVTTKAIENILGKFQETTDYEKEYQEFARIFIEKTENKTRKFWMFYSNEVLFKNWMKLQKKDNGENYSIKTIEDYIRALKKDTEKLNLDDSIHNNLFEYYNPIVFKKVKETIFKHPKFESIRIESGHSDYKKGIEYYEKFLEEDSKGLVNSTILNEKRYKKMSKISKNTILYGPPGTGKTYNSIIYAVSIIENRTLEDVMEEEYEKVYNRYQEYKKEGLIEFTTFHQSYGYEEFIEGIKPVMDSEDEEKSDVQYELKAGIFKNFCEKAMRPIIEDEEDTGIKENPTIWKVSLEGTGDNETRRECLKNGHIRIGWDEYGDIKSIEELSRGKTILNAFMNTMEIGDIILSCYSHKTIDAIGVVVGEYEWHDEYKSYKRLRKVKWLVKGINEDIVEINNNIKLTLSTVYKLKISLVDVMNIVNKYNSNDNEIVTRENDKNYVFIIDEINRGNISKVFGELITLIEPTKRIGQLESTKVRLPYSQELFGVSNNVYIIGTMNTADRSIAAIDTALRRRFYFKEMQPNPNLLEGIEIKGLNIKDMLVKINKRISVLYDREHTIGHSYFLPLREESTIEKLAEIFENNIVPLLQEYFYEDYERIRLVLGDYNKEKDEQFIVKIKDDSSLFKNSDFDFELTDSYEINLEAFYEIAAYKKI